MTDTTSAARAADLGAAPTPTGLSLAPGIPICQTDLPLDWYQAELKPYAEEYLALPFLVLFVAGYYWAAIATLYQEYRLRLNWQKPPAD